MKRLLLILLAGCGSTASPTHASVTQQLVKLADTDGDGTVSAAEFEAGRLPGDTSPTADRNGDGTVSPVELEQWFLSTNPTKAQQAAQRANKGDGPDNARPLGPGPVGAGPDGPRPPQGPPPARGAKAPPPRTGP